MVRMGLRMQPKRTVSARCGERAPMQYPGGLNSALKRQHAFVDRSGNSHRLERISGSVGAGITGTQQQHWLPTRLGSIDVVYTIADTAGQE